MTVKVELGNGAVIDVPSVEEEAAFKAQQAAEIGARYSTPVVLSKGPVGHRIPSYETVMRFGRRAGKAQEPMGTQKAHDEAMVLGRKIAKLRDQLDSIAIAKEAVTNAGDMEAVSSDTILVRRLKAVMEKLHEAYAYVARGLYDAEQKEKRLEGEVESK